MESGTVFLSTLRPGRYRTGRKTRSQRPDGLSRRRWDFPRIEADAQVTHWEAPTWPGARNVPQDRLCVEWQEVSLSSGGIAIAIPRHAVRCCLSIPQGYRSSGAFHS
jgi:hypothetical protein